MQNSKVKVNERIKSPEVQLITQDGENLGVVTIGEALNRAQEAGLDLIEIAPNAKPPVCKIIDHGKFKYELQKKNNQAKKKQKIIHLKELKLRPNTDKHDYDFKLKAAGKFLTSGDKVKFTIRFKGREMEYMEAADNMAKRIIEDTKSIGKVEQPPKLEGRQMTLIISSN
jgi:translation initiation factor IF-3